MQSAPAKTRIAATLVDIVVLGMLQQMLTGYYTRGSVLWTGLAVVLIGWLYFAVFETASSQGSVGKVVFRNRVTDMNGQEIGFGKSTVRYFIMLATVLPLGFGFWPMLNREDGLTLYDRFSCTRVVKTPNA